MFRARVVVLCAVTLLALPANATAGLADDPPRNELSLDLSWPVLAPEYARAVAPDWAVGVRANISLAFVLWGVWEYHDPTQYGPTRAMRVSSEHASSDAYAIVEGIRAEVFARHRWRASWSYDIGLRGSLILHDTRHEAEPRGATFVGVFTGLDYHTGPWRIGPRIAVGQWREENEDRALAVHVMPINVRLTHDF